LLLLWHVWYTVYKLNNILIHSNNYVKCDWRLSVPVVWVCIGWTVPLCTEPDPLKPETLPGVAAVVDGARFSEKAKSTTYFLPKR